MAQLTERLLDMHEVLGSVPGLTSCEPGRVVILGYIASFKPQLCASPSPGVQVSLSLYICALRLLLSCPILSSRRLSVEIR